MLFLIILLIGPIAERVSQIRFFQRFFFLGCWDIFFYRCPCVCPLFFAPGFINVFNADKPLSVMGFGVNKTRKRSDKAACVQ